MGVPSRRLSRRFHRRGQAVVDYLILTAVIVAVALPILQDVLFKPLNEKFFQRRGELVAFVGQERSIRGGKKVPNAWFGAAEKNFTLNEPKNFNEPQIGEPPPKGEPSIDAKNFKEPKGLKAGELKAKNFTGEPGSNLGGGGNSLNPGNLQANNNFADTSNALPSGNGAFGGGGGNGGGGGGGGVFGGKGTGGGASSKVADDGSGGGGKKSSLYAGGGEFDVDAGDSGGSFGGGGRGKSKARGQEQRAQGADKKEGGVGAAKGALSEASRAAAEERARGSKFDWSMVIRVLLILLIVFLLVMILLSNLKKR